MKLLVLLACVSMQIFFASSTPILNTQVCALSNDLSIYTECIENAIRTAQPLLMKGIPEHNVPTLDPLKIEEYSTKLQIPDLVSWDVKFQNFVVEGFNKLQLTKFSFDPVDNTGALFFHVPHLTFKFNYDVQGKLLGRNIVDSGKYEVHLENVAFSFNGVFKRVDKSGVDHVQLEDLKLKFSVESGNANIVTKDPYMQIMANIGVEYFNKNPQSILRLLHSFFSYVTEDYLKNISNEVFSTIPANKLLPH